MAYNKTMFNTYFIYLCEALALLSFVSSGFIVQYHFRTTHLRKPPGDLIMAICIIQMIYDFHWVTLLPIMSSYFIFSSMNVQNNCKYFGLVNIFCSFLSWNFITCFSIEILIKINNPLSTIYSLRMKIYYISSFLLTTTEIITVHLLGDFGLSNLATCSIKKDTTAEYIYAVIFFLNIPIMFLSILAVLKNPVSRRNKALQGMSWVTLSISITWGLPPLTSFLLLIFDIQSITLTYLAILLGCSSGIVLCFSRLGSKHIIQKFNEILSRKKKKGLTLQLGRERITTGSLVAIVNPHIQAELSILGFFNNINKSMRRDMIIGASLIFVTGINPQCKPSYTYNKQKFIFNSENLNLLERRVGRSLFYEDITFEIWAYQSEIFENIRSICNWSNDRIVEAFCDENNFKRVENGNIGGRSNAFIFSTENDELIVKSITKKERYLLLDILDKYHERIRNCPESRIVRILGMYKIPSSKQSFIIMENTLKNRNKAIVFDLKGSLNDRFAETEDYSKTVLKDQNLIAMNKKIFLDMTRRDSVIKAISEDTRFFQELGIIDYSLLVAFYTESVDFDHRYLLRGNYGQIYSIGIIDFLQQYTLSKRIELAYKKMKCKKNLSVSSPDQYAARLVKFSIHTIFI